MDWSRPCLERIRDAVMDHGQKAYRVSNNQFMCQCPAHGGGDFNAQFKLQPSGKISFRCFSHDCAWSTMLDALDLVHSDFYPPELNPMKHKPVRTVSDLEAFIVVAKNDLEQGKKLTQAEMEKFQWALLKTRGAVA